MNAKIRVVHTLAYIYKTLCLTLFLTGIIGFARHNGSWINYIIVTCILLAIYLSIRLFIYMKTSLSHS